ncbi:uncharacterized protein OCT59_000513 [Rhizophagus irregularis]|uniref:F-box domain-containing protein n=3 Tax=Rhizophagus irregularis TaxID=588596 RepID=A0A015JZF5_RHIIW|nr:hypothetical protein GLOIN_2v1877448 [Rhizophagus irregularis DAOM 181602=DAOM 197198]EXX60474.1 hypothetical protein RirG_179540 [Rhizophagus irregularis DAOM 197198w]POG69561.1 hypothetical protein GLOIN_2v1877448 [Rhizophagus irregularis DAOM 181602=DAOM 197198]UZN99233.1 hypothetical protein OCT59_000513 [Rhizophagus irregularis]GBC48029.1 hypothetical protein GLOIN_2v1877448 [Rhizophagus irregularis DAOM 181602=DAOM 197198]|eukprot:XP_025176427.1 hypothetical protein GLOIN_2v1877448 [Rhizophagus irregularis DAOM 181602=DAOM 197198]
MACSKIFSGDLPELISEIIQYFRNDLSTLHSCILVNRLWCRLAIPLLWEDPFSMKPPKNYIIEIYLHNLNEDDKTKLSEHGINMELIPSNTFFNYPNFIKRLNTWKLICSIEKWVSAVKTLTTEEQFANYFMPETNFLSPLYPHFENITSLIYKSLFKMFIIDNEIKLNTFEIEIITDKDHDYFNDALELILQNSNFICNIKILKLYLSDTIIYPFYFQYPINDNALIKKHLSQIINLQQNLKKILFSSNNFSIYNSLLKNSNCSNTLNTIIFYSVNFKNMTVLYKIFDQLNVLESIHILYCYSLDTDFIQQIINLTKPFKLKSLFLDEVLQIDPLKSLLQKSGDFLENFGFGYGLGLYTSNESKQQLLELIIKYCTNIKFFDLPGFDDQNIYSAFELIKNVAQNLNYLSIDFCKLYDFYNYDTKLSSIVLRNLGQILPFKLEYLSLTLMINTNDFEIFLKNSQNTFIKKLLISNKMQGGIEVILPYIKKYIMKNNSIKYLAIMETFFENTTDIIFKSKDLFSLISLKDEVKEFGEHNIKVQNYYDLQIQVCEFIKEVD